MSSWAESNEIHLVETTSGISLCTALFLKTKLEFMSKIKIADGLNFDKKER